MIDITDIEAIRSGPLVLIAHRGGVVAPNSPECSLNAIRLASEQGYQMVELDVQRSKDGQPIVFHDSDLLIDCGVNNRIADLTIDEIRATFFRASDQRIASLDEVLALCEQRGLGVMLEIKTYLDKHLPEEFFEHIARLIVRYGLDRSTICMTPHPLAMKHMAGKALLRIFAEDAAKAPEGDDLPLRGKFLFHRPCYIPVDAVPSLRAKGALVFPAINEFLYPSHAREELARQDIERFVELGVDGFQIDSCYRGMFHQAQ